MLSFVSSPPLKPLLYPAETLKPSPAETIPCCKEGNQRESRLCAYAGTIELLLALSWFISPAETPPLLKPSPSVRREINGKVGSMLVLEQLNSFSLSVGSSPLLKHLPY
ncbi:hypothetical protein Sjap_018116 [Stephania japonica]|uniref:Uncharacterized protein n=1 Tax=Stephania japonica TaxID=461633 RepID=A0AAP0I817_9MAGN